MVDIVYFGDDDLQGAASYLAGVLTYLEKEFDYVSSNQLPEEDFTSKDYKLFIISDYKAENFNEEQMKYINKCVRENGASLLMIGGWDSFGSGGYAGSVIEELLPVKCIDEDDRRQGAPLYRIEKTHDSDFQDISFEDAPCISGFNKVHTKDFTKTILTVKTQKIEDNELQLIKKNTLLVYWNCGHGKVMALTTDLAPHWCGGLVDFGTNRVKISSSEAISFSEIEVGNKYIQFIDKMLGMLLEE